MSVPDAREQTVPWQRFVGFKINECPHVHYYNFVRITVIELLLRFVSATKPRSVKHSLSLQDRDSL
jgi:hypothetical protein